MAIYWYGIFVIINKILFPVLDSDPRPASHQLEADPRHSPGGDCRDDYFDLDDKDMDNCFMLLDRQP